MVCGKGGTGKTVISILLARAFRELNYKPYIIDMDESNELLPQLAGVVKPRPLIELFGGRRGLSQKLKDGEESIVKILKDLTSSESKISSIPREYRSTSEGGINIITIGKIREYSEGCACPLNVFTKILLNKLKIDKDEIVIIDTDAGVEHVGRGVEGFVDSVIAVADPTRESMLIASHLRDICEKINKKYYLILNKVPENLQEKILKICEEYSLKPDEIVPYDEKIFQSCLIGDKLDSDKAYLKIKNFVKKIIEGM